LSGDKCGGAWGNARRRGSWQGSARREGCTRCQEDVEPNGIGQDGRVERFDETDGPGREEITVRVEIRIHVGGQFPAGIEAQRPAAGQHDAYQSHQQNQHNDDDVVTPFLLTCFHGNVH